MTHDHSFFAYCTSLYLCVPCEKPVDQTYNKGACLSLGRGSCLHSTITITRPHAQEDAA